MVDTVRTSSQATEQWDRKLDYGIWYISSRLNYFISLRLGLDLQPDGLTAGLAGRKSIHRLRKKKKEKRQFHKTHVTPDRKRAG